MRHVTKEILNWLKSFRRRVYGWDMDERQQWASQMIDRLFQMWFSQALAETTAVLQSSFPCSYTALEHSWNTVQWAQLTSFWHLQNKLKARQERCASFNNSVYYPIWLNHFENAVQKDVMNEAVRPWCVWTNSKHLAILILFTIITFPILQNTKIRLCW